MPNNRCLQSLKRKFICTFKDMLGWCLMQKEMHLKMENSVFWTDSTPVLKYINDETRRFQIFVANRVTIIREATLKESGWRRGPDFLYRSEGEWPSLD